MKLNRFQTPIAAILVLTACTTAVPPPPSDAPSRLGVVASIEQRLAQFPPTRIDYDRALLDAGEQRVVEKLVEASKIIDQIFWLQVSERNREWHEELARAAQASPQHAAALQYFHIMKGPWDRLVDNEPFLEGVGKKPAGAAFYPEDMQKEELESWVKAHPGEEKRFQDLFTVVRRQGGRLVTIPYSVYYRDLLTQAADLLREAASLTDNASLRTYLTSRAAAFLSDDYYASDIAWMDLDSDIEVVIGPYEVYEDELFNYKAAFESFVTVVDRPESDKLRIYTGHLPAMERNLPMPDEHKNPNRGTDSPIRVVQEIYTAGDARRGVQTAAFNLPNDERVREAKGSKKVLLKNVMEAKFRTTGQPISREVLDPEQLPLVSFQPFFDHVLFHELSHGLGPGIITGPDGKKVENRLLLKELYSSIEEAKADVLGDWNIRYAMQNGLVTGYDEKQLYATNVGVMYRSMRFGVEAAHGKANAVQWNWYREKGAIVPSANGRFRVDFDRMRTAIESLATELLMIEATGDYDRAKRLLDKYGKATAESEAVFARLKSIPVDIAPVFTGAGEK